MRSSAMPGSCWVSTASKLITGITRLLATAPPNGIGDLRNKSPYWLSKHFMVEHYLEVLAYTPPHKGGVFHMIPNMNLDVPALDRRLC